MTNTEWSAAERRLVLAVALAPLVVVAEVAVVAAIMLGGNATEYGLALVVPAYFTLFMFVLPLHGLLRRAGAKGLAGFCVACAGGTLVPWCVLYEVFFGTGPEKYAGAPLEVFGLLMVPTLFATLTAAVVYRLFNPIKGTTHV